MVLNNFNYIKNNYAASSSSSHPLTPLYLALCEYSGTGTTIDIEEARFHLIESTQGPQESALPLKLLGTVEWDLKNTEESLSLFQRGFNEFEDVDCMKFLAMIYGSGDTDRSVVKDMPRALVYHQKLCDLLEFDSMMVVADASIRGQSGVCASVERGLTVLEAAQEMFTDPSRQFDIGRMAWSLQDAFDNPRRQCANISSLEELSIRCFNRASLDGHLESTKQLVRFYSETKDNGVDEMRMFFAALKRGAEQEDPDLMFLLGSMQWEGVEMQGKVVCDQDGEKAIGWLRRAEALGCDKAAQIMAKLNQEIHEHPIDADE